MRAPPNSLVNVLALTLGLALISLLYWPGLHGPFVFDDYLRILNLVAFPVSAFSFDGLLNLIRDENGVLIARPLATVTFALNYFIAQGLNDTFVYKVTNLIIHLANTVSVYWLARLVLGLLDTSEFRRGMPRYIPLCAAIVWGIHPIQLTTVLYVVQRMTSLSALFVLLGLIVFLHGRIRVRQQKPYGFLFMTGGLVVGLVLGFASKENAAVMPLLILVIELVLLQHASDPPACKGGLLTFYGITILLPLIGLITWIILDPGYLLDPYRYREFSLTERLLTQTRVLWYYLQLLALPNIRDLSLSHDDIGLSTGLFAPPSTFAAILGWCAALAAAWIGRKRFPMLAFALLWYLAAHSIESSVVALEIAHEHRNYLPSVGIFVGLAGMAQQAMGRVSTATAVAVTTALISVLGFVTFSRAAIWSNEEALITSMVAHQLGSARAHFMQGELFAQRLGQPMLALQQYEEAASLAAHEPAYRMKCAILKLQLDADGSTESRHPLNPTPAHAPSVPISLEQAPGTHTAINIQPLHIRLALPPLTPMTVHVLDQMLQCIQTQEPVCMHHYALLRIWVPAVMRNPQLLDRHLDKYAVAMFNLATEHRDFDVALDVAHTAEQRDANNPDYILMKANVHLLRGDNHRAREVLDTVSQRWPELPSDTAEKLQFIRNAIRGPHG